MFKQDGVNEKKIELDISVIKDIAKRCCFEIEEYEKAKSTYIRVSKKRTQVLVISTSKEKKRTVKFACLSDIHAGYKEINISKLRAFLNKCKECGIYYILIAGDLFEGNYMFNAQEKLLEKFTPEGQAKILFDVFKDYEFHFIFINGNHDYSFEACNEKNPNRVLKDMMKEIGKKVTYLDSFFADVIINGIGIRLVHLDDSYGKSKEYPCMKYAKEIDFCTMARGNKYPIFALITGHIHKHEIHQYHEAIILQPGSIKETNLEENLRIGFIVKLTVNEDQLEEYLIK